MIGAQRDSSPGYPIKKRAIYYCCRLVSSQYGTVFTNSEYGKIRKVCSIWFCTEVAVKKQNTIKRISLTEEQVFGENISPKENVDLMQAVIVNLGNAETAVRNQILRLMNVLLSEETNAFSKQKVMQEEFHIAMTKQIESEVSDLCDLSYGIYEKGLKKGQAEGREEGRAEGRIEGITASVDLLRDAGLTDEVIVKKIMKKFNLPQEEAENFVFETCTV